jgi:hypothetical protein
MPNRTPERRDPVQQYELRRSRLRWLTCGVLILVLLGAAYWYVYL